MKQEDLLKDKYGKDTGFRVPDGYFKELESRILDNLPPQKVVPEKLSTSRWDRMKPYLYLAAMFCGIWLMMKVFHNVSDTGRLTLDNPPAALVHLVDDDNFDTIFDTDGGEPEYILEEEVSESYDSFEEFQEDFGYSLSPQYSQIKISSHDA